MSEKSVSEKPVIYKRYKAVPLKMWHREYKKNCVGCRYFKDMAVVQDEVFSYVPLENRPVIVDCGLISKKCPKVTLWEDE